MGTSKRDDCSDLANLLRAAAQGDEQARNDLFRQYRSPLLKMVRLRLSRRLQGCLDESGIVQELFQTAASRLPEYQNNPQTSFFLWLRRIAREKLLEVHLQRFGRRSSEVSLHRGALPAADARPLASRLLGRLMRPLPSAVRAEMRVRLQEALNNLAPLDRELLALRHFEQLSNAEAAHELELEPSAAAKHYVRALARLQGILNLNAFDCPTKRASGESDGPISDTA